MRLQPYLSEILTVPVNWNFNLNGEVNLFYFFSFNSNHLLYFLHATTRFYFMFSFNDNLYFSYIPTTLTVPVKWDCHRSCKWDFNRTRSFFGLHALRESCDFDTVCPSVRLSIFISGLAHQIFLKFCMKLRVSKHWKMTEPDFLKKFLLSRKWTEKAQNCPIWHIFVFFSRLLH